jgi:micrococcal nuclease
VESVSDGDTLTCTDDRRIRLTGIDAPEVEQVPFGAQSRSALVEMVAGHTLRLEFDVETTDVFGRTLAYLWREDLFVNEAMVRQGWAVAFPIPPNDRYADRFATAEAAARNEDAGLWATGGFDCLPYDHRDDLC